MLIPRNQLAFRLVNLLFLRSLEEVVYSLWVSLNIIVIMKKRTKKEMMLSSGSSDVPGRAVSLRVIDSHYPTRSRIASRAGADGRLQSVNLQAIEDAGIGKFCNLIPIQIPARAQRWSPCHHIAEIIRLSQAIYKPNISKLANSNVKV